MPSFFVRWGESWMKKHPTWTMKLWTDKEVQFFNNNDLLQKCENLSTRSDIARYEVLYRQGGVFLDNDLECVRNIDMLIQGIEFFACWQQPKILSNSVFGAAKGHKLLQTITWDCRKEFKTDPPDAMGAEYFTKKVTGQPEVRIYQRETFSPYTREQYKAFPKKPMTIVRPPPEAFAINHCARLWYKDQNPAKPVLKTP